MMSILTIAVGWADDVTFSYISKWSSETNINGVNIGNNAISIILNTANANSNNNPKGYSGHFRFYQYNTMTVDAGANTINSIEITCTTNAYASTFKTDGKLDVVTSGTINVSNNVVTISDVDATNLILTHNGTVARVSQIKIYYTNTSGTQTVATPEISGTTPFEESTEVSISCETTGASIYYTTNGDDPTTSSTLYRAPFTINATTTVKAIGVKDGMDNSPIATKIFTAQTTVSSVAEFNALDDGTPFKYTGNNLVAIGQSGKNLFAQDANNGVLLYDSSSSFNGQTYTFGYTIPAGFKGTKTTYNGTVEMTDITGLTAQEDSVGLEPIEISLSQVEENYGRYAVIRGATVNTTDKTLTVGETSIAYYIYSDLFNGTLTDGMTYDVTGICYKFNNKVQFLPMEVTERADYRLIINRGTFYQSVKFTKVSNKLYVVRGLYSGLVDGVEFEEDGIEFGIYDKDNNLIGGDDNGPYEVHSGWFRNIPLESGKPYKFKMRDAGTYDFVIKVDDNGTPTLFVPPVSDIYVKGSFDEWGEGTKFTRNEDGSYTLEGKEINTASEFKIYDAVGNGVWYPGDPSSITANETTVTLKADDGTNCSIPAGKWNFNIDLAKTTMVVSRVLTTHNITLDTEIENGTISIEGGKTTAVVGETVKVIATPDDGYELGKITVTAGEDIIEVSEENTFVMPDADVLVSADFDEAEPESKVYRLVTDESDFVAGKKYLIANLDVESLALIGNLTGSTNKQYAQHVTDGFTYDANSKTITLDDDCATTIIKLGGTTDAWTFYNGSGYLAYTGTSTSSNNYLWVVNDATANGATWKIDLTESVKTVRNNYNNSRYLQYNADYSRFAGYTGTQDGVAFYRQLEKGEVVPTLPTPEINGETPFVENTVVTIVGGTEFGEIHYTLDNSEPTRESTLYEDVIILDKTTTVKAIVYKHIGEGVYEFSAVASKTFVKAEEVANLTEFYAYEGTDEFVFTGDLVAIAQTGQYLYAQEESKGVLIYGTIDKTYSKGDKIPGGFFAKKGAYHGASQMTEPSGMKATTGPVSVEPVALTISQITLDNFARYAVVKDATITSETVNDKTSYYLNVGDDKVVIFDRFSIPLPEDYEGKTYNVIGISGWYDGAQFMPLEYKEVVEPVVLEGVSFTNGRKWATWYDEVDYEKPDGVRAYIVTDIVGDKAMIEAVDYLPSGVGLLLFNDAGLESVSAMPFESSELVDNLGMLKGNVKAAEAENAYVLYNNEFVLLQSDDNEVAAHRCYLPIPEEEDVTSAPRVLRIVTAGTVTAIDDLRFDRNGNPVGYYDLTGRYVGTSLSGKRGIFITSDGKKVVR